ncbi:MAG: DNA primase [Verrucomicrobia bacterium]|nr:DNA primase [Verrucomicrobiota bacterium]
MGLIAPETIEQVSSATDIVELIGSYFPLKRAGTEFRALCPFHDEKTPSFFVSPAKQSYYCFGCGAGGSAFQFLMQYENVDFPEAVRRLARRAGIAIAERESSAEEQAHHQRRSRLLRLHAEAAAWFHHNLLRVKQAEHARIYMQRRGLNIEIAKRWQIGYAPNEWHRFGHWAQDNGYRPEELIESGLVKLRDEPDPHAGYYDRFRDRLMFPIRNEFGEVIAFSGRVLDSAAAGSKYVNSPETSLFSKGSVLFGFDKTKRAIAKSQRAIVLEGQIDLITCFEAGIENIVAPQGTALTEKHAAILRRFADEVLLFFDADGAGQRAAERALEVLYAAGLQVRIGRLPDGEDPDSLIRGQGPAAFQALVDQSKDFFDFEIERFAAEAADPTVAARVTAARKLARFAGLVPDQIVRETMVSRLASRFSLPRPAVEGMVGKPAASQVRIPVAAGARSAALPHKWMVLANIALTDPESRSWVPAQVWKLVLNLLPDAGLLKSIFEADFDPGNPASLATFLATLSPEEASLASQALALTPYPPEGRKAFWVDFVAKQLGLRRAQLERIVRLSSEDPGTAERARQELKEVLDHESDVKDISRLLTRAL